MDANSILGLLDDYFGTIGDIGLGTRAISDFADEVVKLRHLKIGDVERQFSEQSRERTPPWELMSALWDRLRRKNNERALRVGGRHRSQWPHDSGDEGDLGGRTIPEYFRDVASGELPPGKGYSLDDFQRVIQLAVREEREPRFSDLNRVQGSPQTARSGVVDSESIQSPVSQGGVEIETNRNPSPIMEKACASASGVVG